MESAKELREKLMLREANNVDVILPVTYQDIALDRKMAKEFGTSFPLLMGGHDHEPFLETINGCQIVNTGMNADRAAVIDIQ